MELRDIPSPLGVTAEPRMTGLAARAEAYLAAGPADAIALIGHVCQLPGAPLRVAEHMADALLSGYPRFTRDVNGRWALRTINKAMAVMATQEPAPTTGRESADGSFTIRRRALAGLSFTVVDVETTGSRPDRGDRITEIAAVVVQNGQVTERYQTLVNPERPIPPWITALTNISWAMVKDAPPFREVCDRILSLLEGRVFVGHNASFDWRFVSAEIARASGRSLVGDRLCTVRLARKLLPQLPRRSLDYVAAHYGVDIAARHRAMGDAEATAHCLLGLLSDARARGVHHWDELDTLLSEQSVVRRRGRPSALPHAVTRDTTA
ncbi:MAG: hypothetical protein NVS1B4_13190 [Gemmatimonadaceae bacterium]